MIKPKTLGLIAGLTLIVLTFQNCGELADQLRTNSKGEIVEGTSTGNPTVIEGEVVVAPFTGARQISFCVTQTTLYTQNGKPEKMSDDLELVIDDEGSNLGSFGLPQGTYSSIQMRLKNDECGFSLQIVNTDGTQEETDKEFNLNFAGPISISDHGFTLDIQSIVDHIINLPPGKDISDGLEGISGRADDDDD